MFEDGHSNLEGMDFHYVIGYFYLLIMVSSRHGLVGGFGEKIGLGLYSYTLVQIGG